MNFVNRNNMKRGLLAAAVAGVCLSVHGQSPAKTVDVFKPTLDSLKVQSSTSSEAFFDSAYTLTEVSNQVPSEVDTLTTYDLIDNVRYFDLETGLEVAKDNLVAGVNYKQVLYSDAVAKALQLSLKDDVRILGQGSDTRYYNFIIN